MEFKCDICNADFYHKRYLKDHTTRVHGIKSKNAENKEKSANNNKELRLSTVQCQEESCQANLRTVCDLRKHLVNIHKITDFGNHQDLEFENYTVFLEWLAQEEKNSNSKFVVNSKKKMKDFSYVSFICSRSGTYKSKVENRKRQLKTKGSKKLGFSCTAGLQVKDNGDHISVKYFNCHYKHTCSNTCVTARRNCAICSTASICNCHDHQISNFICKHIHFTEHEDYTGPLNTQNNCNSTETSLLENSQPSCHEANKLKIRSLRSKLNMLENIDDNVSQQIKHHLNAIEHLMGTKVGNFLASRQVDSEPFNKKITKQK